MEERRGEERREEREERREEERRGDRYKEWPKGLRYDLLLIDLQKWNEWWDSRSNDVRPVSELRRQKLEEERGELCGALDFSMMNISRSRMSSSNSDDQLEVNVMVLRYQGSHQIN